MPGEETLFQGEVIRLARQYGFLVYHTVNSRRSIKGWPDLILLKPTRLIVAELKVETGKLSHEQEVWMNTFSELAAYGLAMGFDGVEAYVWRPSMMDTILKCLSTPLHG